MRYTIYGKNMHVSDDLKDMLKQKFSKFDRYFNPETEVYVTFSKEKKKYMIEVTIPLGQSVLRAEKSSEDMKSAISKVLNGLEGQLRKHKTKLQRHYGDEFKKVHLDQIEEDPSQEERKVVRIKKFPIKPMNVEEATLQMEMLEHDFFVFLNSDTDDVNVVYLRKDGNYGLIEPYI